MAIFGFVCLFLMLASLTIGLIIIVVYDGALGGRREVPLIWAMLLFGLFIYGWYFLFSTSPFTITIN